MSQTKSGHLVVTRYPEESVTITVPASDKATTIEVTCIGVQGLQTRMGFKAERYVKILRNELLTRDQQQASA